MNAYCVVYMKQNNFIHFKLNYAMLRTIIYEYIDLCFTNYDKC